MQYDPNLPMRGRYMALTPLVDACGLLRDKDVNQEPYRGKPYSKQFANERWRIITKAKDGKLVVEDARSQVPLSDAQTIYLMIGQPCDSVPLQPPIGFFIPDTAEPPFPRKPGQVLWAEVTVPPSGPPRPIQLAMSDNGQWKVLQLN
jgi:hypothetical protein